MSRVYDSEVFEGGDMLDVHRPNAELRNFVGEMNGNLDRDNIPPGQELLPSKVAKTTFNERLAVQLNGGGPAVFVTLPEGLVSGWLTVLSGSTNTDDGRMVVEAQLSCVPTIAAIGLVPPSFEELGIFVDGQLVARSGPASKGVVTVKAIAAPPVGPGEHVVAVKGRWRGTPDVLVSLFARHMRR